MDMPPAAKPAFLAVKVRRPFFIGRSLKVTRPKRFVRALRARMPAPETRTVAERTATTGGVGHGDGQAPQLARRRGCPVRAIRRR